MPARRALVVSEISTNVTHEGDNTIRYDTIESLTWTRKLSEQNEVDGMKKGAYSTGKVMHI